MKICIKYYSLDIHMALYTSLNALYSIQYLWRNTPNMRNNTNFDVNQKE